MVLIFYPHQWLEIFFSCFNSLLLILKLEKTWRNILSQISAGVLSDTSSNTSCKVLKLAYGKGVLWEKFKFKIFYTKTKRSFHFPLAFEISLCILPIFKKSWSSDIPGLLKNLKYPPWLNYRRLRDNEIMKLNCLSYSMEDTYINTVRDQKYSPGFP